jgi:hypothetical protein
VTKLFLLGYAGVSLFIHAAALRQSIKEREPAYRIALEAATSLFVLIGVVAFALGVHARLSLAWRFLAPPLITTYLWLAVTEVREISQHQDPELSPREHQVITIVGVAAAILILGPGVWVTFVVAQGVS